MNYVYRRGGILYVKIGDFAERITLAFNMSVMLSFPYSQYVDTKE